METVSHSPDSEASGPERCWVLVGQESNSQGAMAMVHLRSLLQRWLETGIKCRGFGLVTFTLVRCTMATSFQRWSLWTTFLGT